MQLKGQESMSSMPRTPRLAIALLVLVAGPCVSQSRHLKQEVAGNFVGCSVFPGQPDGLSQELLASAPKDEETLFGFFLPANGSDAPVPMHGPLQVRDTTCLFRTSRTTLYYLPYFGTLPQNTQLRRHGT